ncbi:MAG TPA: M14 family zinc carboxypeptidase [Candidatus Dormibacteraeota bacterium]|nr:M14 family zinc carboxypeptidase [Candidatus Dormibacteraeota bacterium]
MKSMLSAFVVVLAVLGMATEALDKDLSNTLYRELPPSRAVADLGVGDFFDNMQAGFFTNLEKTGPGSFVFDLQQPSIYGEQGTLRVWFYVLCDLRNVKVESGEALHMALRWPVGNTFMRPVYSYDAAEWSLVPDGWGRKSDDDKLFRFDVPLRAGVDRVYFAAHYPYPADRVLERAIQEAKNPYVRSIQILGRSERDRPIVLLTITDPKTSDLTKHRVLLSSGDHAGETASMWGLEGSIDFLLSKDTVARSLRRSVVFYVVPMLNVDGFAIGTDRRQATGVNLYFDYQKFESREARLMWKEVNAIKPALWLDYHSWHLGKAEGLYGPHPKFTGEEKYQQVVPLIDAIGKYFPINHRGPDTLDSPNTQALLKLGIPGFCPEFNFGKGADGNWKSAADQKALGVKILMGVSDYLKTGIATKIGAKGKPEGKK